MEVWKPMTDGCEQVEEGTTTSGMDARTVWKSTGKAPDMQNIWDITETVTEERVMEEIPPNTWEQVLRFGICNHRITKKISKFIDA